MKLTKIFSLTKNNKEGIDYNHYDFTTGELIRFLLEGCVTIGLVSILFYDSVLPFFILVVPYLYIYLSKKKKELCEKRKQALISQFREAILSVSSHLQAGFSIENAFMESYRDIRQFYGRDSLMGRELSGILRRLENNEQLEQLLCELADRSGLEDINEFAGVFSIAKRGGGDFRGMIARTAAMIGDKIEVRREIETIMSEKKLEQKIMQYIPFIMMGYLSLTSKGFFDSLYHNMTGILLMTACLAVYLFACYWSEKILAIEI